MIRFQTISTSDVQHYQFMENLLIVLEVEMPVEEMAKRRINFYQRQGFVLWEKEYKQPPYKPGDDFLPMYLMVFGNLQCEQDFEMIKNKIHKEVYNVKE